MTFQAYIDNIKAKTGKSPEDFMNLAKQKGILKPDMKATAFVSWLEKISASVTGTQWQFGRCLRKRGGSRIPKRRS